MKKFFKWLLILTVALMIGVVVLIYNPSLIKGPLERYLSDLTGHSISLQGDLRIDTGRLTELTVFNIHVSAPVWAGNDDLAFVGYLKLGLDTASIFKDIIVVDFLQVDDLQLNLETRADGANNWISANNQPSEPESSAGDPVVMFNTVQVTNTSLRYLNGTKGREQVFHIETLDQVQQLDGMLALDLDGNFNSNPVEFTGTIGPYVNLLQGHDISYTATGNFGNLHINSKGLIDDLLKPRRPHFELEMQGPNIDEITSMFQLDDLGSGGFSLRARGKAIGGHYETGIDGKIGDVALGISVQATDLLELDELDLKVAVNGPSLGSFTRVFGIENWPDKPFSIKGDVARIGSTLNISSLTLSIGGTKLTLDALLSDFPNFDASRTRLSVVGDDVAQFRELLGISGVATGPFEVKGKLDVSPQEVELLQLELRTSLGNLTLSGTLGAAPTYNGSRLHLHMDGNNANTLMSVFDIDILPKQPFNLDAQIETTRHGLLIDRSVLVTIQDERLELGGFLSFNPGGVGTDIEVSIEGQHLARVLGKLMGDTEFPDLPYSTSGQIHVLETGIQFENTKAAFADIELSLNGLLSLRDQPPDTGFDFQIDGKDLSSLEELTDLGGSLGVFVPGQSYHATGHFGVANSGWKLDGIKGRIGKTDITVDGLISKQPDWAGTNVRYSIKGPDLHALLAYQDKSDLPIGKFEASGQVTLSDNTLNVKNFSFEAVHAHGKADLEFGWPISSSVNTDFNIDIWGDDIRHLFPRTTLFDPEMAAYRIIVVGHKRGDLISVKHFEADSGNLNISLKGKVYQDPTVENVDITFSAVSNDLSTLGRLNGKPLPAMALDLKAGIDGNARQFRLHNIAGTLGKSDISGILEISLKNPKPTINLEVKSDLIDLRPFLELAETDDKETTGSDQERLIPATPLPLDAMASADMTIKLEVVELRHQSDSIKNLDLEAELRSGSLNVPKFSLEGPRGKLETSFSIQPTDAIKADVKIELSAKGLSFNFSGQPQEKLNRAPAVDISFQASGRGGNLQELAGSLNGFLYLGSEGGILEDVNLSILDTFILDEVFSLIMPKTDKNDDLNLSCAAAMLKITDGLVETDPAFTFITDRITLVSKGKLDLETEKLKLNFNATPNNALKISAGELFNPYILVGGTLSKPVVGLDPAKVLLHGGAAVGTAGISILAKGLLDRISNTIPLCEEMLKQARQEQ